MKNKRKELSEFELQADEFCRKTGTKITMSYKEKVHNPWNCKDFSANWWHDIYRVKISRNHKSYSFDFTQSKNDTDNGIRPTKYDILACVTKSDPEDFEWFCKEFGYDQFEDSSKRTYKAVQKEYHNILRIFGDVMEELYEFA